MEESPSKTPQPADVPSLHAVVADTVSDLIDGVVSVDRTIANLHALRARMLHEAVLWSGLASTSEDARSSHSFRSLRAELACATRVPERTAERQLAESECLTRTLPSTLAALVEGDISYRHAQALVDAVATLDSEQASALETAALPFATHLTAAKFERKVRVLRERLAPDCAPERHRAEVEKREVSCTPAQDGMAWLSAYLPAADAIGIYNRITDVARSWKRSGCDDLPGGRTLTQRRADAFRDLLLNGEVTACAAADAATADAAEFDRAGSDSAGSDRAGSDATEADATGSYGAGSNGAPRLPINYGIRPKVFVTVPVLGLLGHTDEPAILDGYGPIDMETARELAAHAPSFVRLLTSPNTGAVLSVGRDSYRVPADLKHWLHVRDGTCRFPGCARAAVHSDLDHTDDWAFGNDTCHDNLAHLCPSHHTLKHSTAWRVQHAHPGRGTAPGTLSWTSPLGRRYVTEPATVMRA